MKSALLILGAIAVVALAIAAVAASKPDKAVVAQGNYLVNRVNEIVLDMEKAATEVVNIVCDSPGLRSQ